MEQTLEGSRERADDLGGAAAPLQPGSTVGRYTVLERIGAGGMGVVYSAFDPELDRRIALKVMHSGPSNLGTSGKSRLLQEAQAMAKLSHPNVITVHDVGMFGDRVFVAMEYIDGVTLRTWLEQEGHDWSAVVQAFVAAGRGLAAAHAAGLVHRDFKPDNVLMGRDGRVLVMDFGIARRTGEADTVASGTRKIKRKLGHGAEVSLTRTGAMLGTPAYMAPEQHRGESAGPLADQFSFCVALYEGLYAERPFAGNSVTSLAMHVLDGDVRAAPRESRVPEWLRQVVLRGLGTDPMDRYPSMDALLAELQQDPPQARHPWLAAVVAAAVAIAGIGGYLLATRSTELQTCEEATDASLEPVWGDARRQAVERAFLATGLPYASTSWTSARERVQGHVDRWSATSRQVCELSRRAHAPAQAEVLRARQACTTHALTALQSLVRRFEEADPTTVRQAVAAASSLPAPEGCLRGEVSLGLGTPPVTQAMEVLARAEAALATGDPATALELVRPLPDRAEKLDAPALEARTSLARAAAERAAGTATGDADLLRAVLAAARAQRPELEARAWIAMLEHLEPGPERVREGKRIELAAQAAMARASRPEALRSRLELAMGAFAQRDGRYDAAREHFEKAAAWESAAGGAEGLTQATAWEGLGAALQGASRFREAVEAHERALAIRERLLGSEHPIVTETLVGLASAQLGAGRALAAEASLARARFALASDDAPSLRARVLDQLGLVHRTEEEFEDAERLHREAIALLEPDGGVDLAYPLENLGVSLTDQDRQAQAVPPLSRALELWQRRLPADHPDLAVAHLNLANALWATERFTEARDHYAQALEIWEATLPDQHPLLAYALTGLGRTHLELGDAEAALPVLRRAYPLRDHEAEDELNLAETNLLLARALWQTGEDPQEAIERLIRARDIVGAYEPAELPGIKRVLGGAEVERFTDQLEPAGLGTTNRLELAE